MGHPAALFPDSAPLRAIPQLTCSLCYGVHVEPTETPCGHVFCSECIHHFVQSQTSCPECANKISSTRMLRFSPLMENILEKFPMRCPDCLWSGTYSLFTTQHRNCSGGSGIRRSEPISSATPKDESNFMKRFSNFQESSVPLSNAPRMSGVQKFGQKVPSRPASPQFSFPAISMTEPSYSNKRTCAGCGGQGNSKEISAVTNLCSHCATY